MSDKSSVWTRIAHWFRPERETYDTRKPRGGEPAGLAPQINESTDGRRHGGTMQMGG